MVGAVAGALALLVVATAMPTNAAAETRTLDLYYTHTKERLTITFKKNGKYIPSALKELNRFLRDWRRNEPTNMDPRLFDTVWEVYQQSGSRQPIHIVSAYRSLATNNMLRSRSKGVAKHSQHSLGKAMDFFLPDVGVAKLRAIGMKLQRGGVGYYPNAGNAFVHIDVGSVRAWPRMSRQQLAKLFPDGKTVHLPADGKPLAGYQQALAELKRNGASARPLAMAEAGESGGSRRKVGLLAMLFGDEEDATEELNAASTTGKSLTAPPDEESAPAVVRTQRVTPPAVAPAPAAPVVVADVPKPARAPEPPAPASLADATLPAGAPAPAEAPADVAAAAPPPRPKQKPEELVALAALPEPPAMTPREKPPELLAAMAAAAMPPVRPSLPTVAEAAVPAPAATPGQDEPASAALALAEVAQDPVEDRRALTALGYASAQADPVVAPKPVLPPAPGAPRIARAAVTSDLTMPSPAIGGQGDPLAPLPLGLTEKSDPLAILTSALPPADMPVYDGAASVTHGDFAFLRHPDQMSTDLLFEAPATVVSAGFSTVRTAGLETNRFTGAAVARVDVVTFQKRRDLAMR
ncbi:DUF882 domain-containing protein [Chthonobacter rhizosphaerae]|uniref:DUF882 domain-containing protein n=1 Tax=Chthonobacter rhizosphaerae TaxID=2735553 RepID=UPI0015EEF3B7|nr:DUF882 domain-containing protein [Chthonobacter rhizosphaerae]